MGIINKIREKTGIAVGIIALGLILFLVGGDILGPNSILLGRNQNIIGEIAGEDIRIEAYRNVVEELAQNYAANYGKSPDGQAMQSIREEAWQTLIRRIAYAAQYENLGLSVPDAELVDMVQGEHIRPELKQAFKDPETDDFDKAQIISYLQNIDDLPPERQALWYNFERNLRPSRLLEKYNQLFAKTYYVTAYEAQINHQESNESMSLRYLYIPYRNFHDSLFDASTQEERQYLRKHAQEYERKRTRSLHYVSFPINTSSEDSAYAREEASRLIDAFVQATEDSLFAQVHTEGQDPYKSYTIEALPKTLSEHKPTTWVADTVLGPFLERNTYVLYKIAQIEADTIPYVRASHILFKSDKDAADEDKAKKEAKKKAKEILRDIQAGESFEDMAQKHGTDGTATKGGDLGWFTKGRMVAAFEKVAFEATEIGLIPRVVETDFGFHLIKITGLPHYNKYFIARMAKEIVAGEKTRNTAYTQAAALVSHSQDTASFQAYVTNHNLNLQTADGIGANQNRLGAFSQARQVVAWLFREATSGVISDVFEMDKAFLVCMMNQEQPEGTANYEDVQSTLQEKVYNQKKALHIQKRLDTLFHEADTVSFEKIAAAFPEGAYIYSATNLKLSDQLLRNVGIAPKAIGVAYALEEGQRSDPVVEDKGVLILEVESKTPASELTDYNSVIEKIKKKQGTRAASDVGEVIKKMSDIQDKRYKFF